VLTTPVIRALKQQLKGEVHLLTKRSFAGVLAANPHLDRIWAIDKKVQEVLPELRKEGFTAIVDLHRNLRSWQVRLGLWKVPAYRFDKLNGKKWLLTRWKINRLPDVHIVDRYYAAAKPLGIQPDGKGLDYFISPEDRVDPAPWLPQAKLTPYVALVIGAAHATKRLPTEQIIQLCHKLPKPVLLLGGPGEAEEGQAIARAVGDQVVNLCGELRLHQSASVVEQAAVVVTHDTGLMHVAAAFARPVISIWGNTVPEFGMYPYNPQNHFMAFQSEVKDLACRPCSKIGHQACPQGHFRCMLSQPLDQIARWANQIISG